MSTRQPAAVEVDRGVDLGGVRGEHERRELRHGRVERELRPHRLPVAPRRSPGSSVRRPSAGPWRPARSRSRSSAARRGIGGRSVGVAGGQRGDRRQAGAEEGTAGGCGHDLGPHRVRGRRQRARVSATPDPRADRHGVDGGGLVVEAGDPVGVRREAAFDVGRELVLPVPDGRAQRVVVDGLETPGRQEDDGVRRQVVVGERVHGPAHRCVSGVRRVGVRGQQVGVGEDVDQRAVADHDRAGPGHLELHDDGAGEQVHLGADAAAPLGQRHAAAGLLVDHVGVHALRAEAGGDRVADGALAGVVAARDRVAAGG